MGIDDCGDGSMHDVGVLLVDIMYLSRAFDDPGVGVTVMSVNFVAKLFVF